MMKKVVHWLLSLLVITSFFGLHATSAYASVVSTTTLNPSADTYTDQNSASTNYGTNSLVHVKNQTDRSRYTFLKFNVSSASAIHHAKLRIYGKANSGDSILNAYAISNDSWSENTLTWNNMPAVGVMVGSTVAKVKAETYWDIDLTNYVIGQKAADGIVSIVLQSTNSNNLAFHSKEHTSNPPRLILYTSTPDTAAPSQPTNVTAIGISSSTVHLRWNAATDNVGIKGYVVYRNGQEIGRTKVTTYKAEGLTPSTSYSFTIKAYDTSDNMSLGSNAVSAAALPNSVLYVDPTGSNGAYTTIQAAVNAAQPGNTVVINTGVYTENITIANSGTSSGTLTIKAANNSVLVNGWIVVNGSYVRIEGLRMDGHNTNGTYIQTAAVKAKGSHIHVVGLNIRNYASTAVYYENAPHGYAADNYVYNSAGGFQASSNSIFERNEIEYLNLLGNTSASGDHFRVFGTNIIFRDNVAHGTVKGPHLVPAHVDMFQSWDDAQIDVKNILIENNILTSWHHQGIMLENDKYGPNGTYHISDWTVRNNVFAGYESWGISAGKTNGGIPNMVVENNVFAGDSSGGGYYGVFFIGQGGSGTVRNNIFMNQTTASTGTQSGAAMNADYNLYYNTIAPSTPGANNLIGIDPQFVSASTGNYHLKSTSPAINAGAASPGLSFDLDRNSRPHSYVWDIGPYEFQ